MSSTEWEETGDVDSEQVDPEELDDAPPGSAEEVPGVDEGDVAAGSGWTSGGGVLPPEGEDADDD